MNIDEIFTAQVSVPIFNIYRFTQCKIIKYFKMSRKMLNNYNFFCLILV